MPILLAGILNDLRTDRWSLGEQILLPWSLYVLGDESEMEDKTTHVQNEIETALCVRAEKAAQ